MAEEQLPNEAWIALGRVVSGVFVITAGRGKRATGMLGSWVQQCAFDPPQVTVVIQRDRPIIERLSEGADLTVNILAEGEKDLMKHFGKGFALDEAAFEGIAIADDTGPPVLAAALAFLRCRVVATLPVGDHHLFVARVVGGGTSHEGRPKTHIRNSGSHY